MTLRYERRALFHLPSTGEIFFLGRQLAFDGYKGLVGFKKLAGCLVKECKFTVVLDGKQRIALEPGQGGRIRFCDNGFQDEEFRIADMDAMLFDTLVQDPYHSASSEDSKMKARRHKEACWRFSRTDTPELWSRVHRVLIEREGLSGVHLTSRALGVVRSEG